MANFTEEFEKALALSATDKHSAIDIFHRLVKQDFEQSDDEGNKIKEQSILELGSLLSKTGQAEELGGLIKFTRPFLALVSKAKAAKLVRALVDLFLDMEASTGSEVTLCLECIEWAKQEKRTFLRQALQARLIALYFDTKQYQEALSVGSTLLKELKKLDDKALLVEVQLLESKVYHALSNLQKSRAALTSARTTANAIYCPPKLQAALDLQSGVLHAADERDFKTAYSYFYEAFEGYDSIDSPKAIDALKYMLLSKIMLNSPDDVQSIVSGKLALRYAGANVEALKSIATASQNRSLSDFQKDQCCEFLDPPSDRETMSSLIIRWATFLCRSSFLTFTFDKLPKTQIKLYALANYTDELQEDPIIQAHLDSLYDNLLEQNLCRIIEPFSRVQVQHISGIIKLPLDLVERKLSQMILDKKFHGILDQGEGVLIVFNEPVVDQTYEMALETIQSMGKVVDSLYNKTHKLH